jgi:UDP-N-acetylmuramoyl-tripeptide--D-alanyl-D-alanine ligase
MTARMSTPLWTSAEAAAATGGQVASDWTATGISIDSRTVAAGDLFVALSAARDGHDFVADALEKGAVAALVSRNPEGVDPARLLIVPDVLEGLADLGRAARARTGAKVVAVTGSVGKTTVKEMLRKTLAGQGRTHAAEASFNNHWGVPVTLARMPIDTDYAIIEIGMNAPGEIAPLARMARPDVAVVTTVAPAHLEAFGVIEGIAREKASIFEGLVPGGVALAHADVDTAPILFDKARDVGARLIGFGEAADATIRITDLRLSDAGSVVRAQMADGPLLYKLSVPGRHNAVNGLIALAVCEALGRRCLRGRHHARRVGARDGTRHARDAGPRRRGGPRDRADRRRLQRQSRLAQGRARRAGLDRPGPGRAARGDPRRHAGTGTGCARDPCRGRR